MGYVWADGLPGKTEHVAIAERAYGGPLPAGAEVHHWDEDKKNNAPSNLVVCPNHAYHQLLHYRARALDACGSAGHCKCEYCKVWDDPVNLVRQDRGRAGVRYRHRACHTANQIARKRRQNLLKELST